MVVIESGGFRDAVFLFQASGYDGVYFKLIIYF